MHEIKIENLTVSFGGHDVIKNVSFCVNSGERIAIIGGSGSGKSVLLKSIVGLNHKNNGEITIDDVPVTQDVEKNTKKYNIAMTFQHDALFDSMTVSENLRFVLVKKNIAKKHETKLIIEAAMEEIGLKKDVLNLYPSDLSGGMRKRIAIIRALIIKPSIVFFDEPTTGLDPITSGNITDIIYRYVSLPHVTSVVVTHSMICAKKLATKIIMIHEGKIRWQGKTEELHNSTDEYVKRFIA